MTQHVSQRFRVSENISQSHHYVRQEFAMFQSGLTSTCTAVNCCGTCACHEPTTLGKIEWCLIVNNHSLITSSGIHNSTSPDGPSSPSCRPSRRICQAFRLVAGINLDLRPETQGNGKGLLEETKEWKHDCSVIYLCGSI